MSFQPTVNATAATTEEIDSLQRSTKKYKTLGTEPNKDLNEETMADVQHKRKTETPSFKEALLKHHDNSLMNNECWADLLQEDASEIKGYQEDMEEPNNLNIAPLIPVVQVTKEDLESYAKPWRNTLIVKVLGKKVNYRVLENKLKRGWVQSGTIKITDLADDFYLVHLSSIDDYKHALFEGPWKVVDHYLIVQRWRPFLSLTASIS